MLDHWSAFRDQLDVRRLAEDWLTAPRPDWTDADSLLDAWIAREPDKALAVICSILQIAPDGSSFPLLAAGPLEDWLCRHGEAGLEDVRALAHTHEDFRGLMGGVWQNSMPKVLYQKVRAIGVGRL